MHAGQTAPLIAAAAATRTPIPIPDAIIEFASRTRSTSSRLVDSSLWLSSITPGRRETDAAQADRGIAFRCEC